MKIKHGGEEKGRVDFDFSVNLNPLGIPPQIKEAAAGADFVNYPDPDCSELCAAISENEGISAENIVCGNGAADLIYRIVGAVKPKTALIAEPTFSEYQKALSDFDCKTERYLTNESNNFELKEDFLDRITDRIDMVFICNPNNPTGITCEIIGKIAEKCAKKGALFVADESFIDFVNNGENRSVKPFLNDKTVILKSFTKIYAMAGLRLGYAIFGNSTLANRVREFGQSWSVSSAAQAAGIAALKYKDFLCEMREIIKQERAFLTSELTALGIKVFPSETNFLLLKSDKPLKEMLLKKYISIRSCENFCGLDKSFFRIAVRSHSENTALINALKELL